MEKLPNQKPDQTGPIASSLLETAQGISVSFTNCIPMHFQIRDVLLERTTGFWNSLWSLAGM